MSTKKVLAAATGCVATLTLFASAPTTQSDPACAEVPKLESGYEAAQQWRVDYLDANPKPTLTTLRALDNNTKALDATFKALQQAVENCH